MAVTTAGYRLPQDEEGPLYRSGGGEEPVSARLRWIPYYAWANRGENEMRVWCL